MTFFARFAVIALWVASACCPQEPCTAHLHPGVEGVWCPAAPPTELVIDESAPCAVELVESAERLWGELGAIPARVGPVPLPGREREGEIYLSVGDVPGPHVGNTEWYRVHHVNQWARITVESCNLQDIAHELGHAIGFGHSPNPDDLMYETDLESAWDIPAALLEAYAESR